MAGTIDDFDDDWFDDGDNYDYVEDSYDLAVRYTMKVSYYLLNIT